MVKEITLRPLPPVIEPAGGAKGSAARGAGAADFGALLNEAVNRLNESQVRADDAVRQFLAGEVQDVHQVIIALREAELTMQLAVEVRNRLLEAYQELSRTPL